MKLNAEGRERLRKAVDDKINEISRNARHSFRINFSNKEILDELLFEHKVDKDGVKYKVMGYASRNLKHVDLSEVSFEDVSFDYVNIDKNKILHMNSTNAKVDLKKTYEYKKYKQVVLTNVDFSYFHFENASDINRTLKNALIINCDLSWDDIKLTQSDLHCHSSNLSHNDFSKLNMFPSEVYLAFHDCNLRDTGLNFKITDAISQETIKEVMSSSFYLGCYVNGKLLKTKEEKISKASELLEDYEAWSKVYIDDAIDGISYTVGYMRAFEGKRRRKNLVSDQNKETAEKTNVGSFYGCDNVPEEVEEPKEETTGLGSFYGCGNVPEEVEEPKPKKKKGKTLKKTKEKNFLDGIDAYLNEDIDE